jgi:hypothetical protein
LIYFCFGFASEHFQKVEYGGRMENGRKTALEKKTSVFTLHFAAGGRKRRVITEAEKSVLFALGSAPYGFIGRTWSVRIGSIGCIR